MKIKFLAIAFALIVITSCSKDSVTTDAPTIEQLLTQKAWKVEEIRAQVSNNTTYYYQRGSSTNPVDFNSDSLRFNLDNTGTHYYMGTQYSTTWSFSNTEKSKMTLVINSPTPETVYLENINITQTYFKYTQYKITPSLSYMASCTRTQNQRTMAIRCCK